MFINNAQPLKLDHKECRLASLLRGGPALLRKIPLLPYIVAAVLFGFSCVSPVSAARVKLMSETINNPDWVRSQATDISDNGHVVGQFYDGANNIGFLNDGTTTVELLPDGWTSSQPAAVNNSGQVTGDGSGGPFLYSAGTFITIAPPAGWSTFHPRSINSAGDIAGWASGGVSTPCFIYSDGSYTNITPPGWTNCYPNDMNDNGNVVGTGSAGAFLYSGGEWTDPAPSGWINLSDLRINNRGTIVSRGIFDDTYSIMLSRDETAERVLPPDWLESFPMALTENDDILGVGTNDQGAFKAFLYRDGTYYGLESADVFGNAISLAPIGSFSPLSMNSSYRLAGIDGNFAVSSKAEKADGPTEQNAAVATLLPHPVLESNIKGPFADGSYIPRISLRSWSYPGKMADYWLIAQTPVGTMSFDLAARMWVPGFAPSISGPIRDIDPTKVTPAGTMPGIYTYYFGVDLVRNGELDPRALIYDKITVLKR